MSKVDRDAVNQSTKALWILFIIAISTSSLILLALIWYQLRKAGFNLRQGFVFVITCGTLLYSLFYPVVYLAAVFKTLTITCQTAYLARVYADQYFPFVYALSLVEIALELCIAKAGYTFLQSLTKRMVYIAVPWIAGCIFVLPLTLAGVDMIGCRAPSTLARKRAIVWICNLLPALAVFVSYVVVCFVRSNSSHSTNNPRIAPNRNNTSTCNSSLSSICQQARNTSQGSGVLIPSAPPAPDYHSEAEYSYQTAANSPVLPPSYEECMQFCRDNLDNKQNTQEQQTHHLRVLGSDYNSFYCTPKCLNPRSQCPQQQAMASCDAPSQGMSLEREPVAEASRDVIGEVITFALVAGLFVICSLPKTIFVLAYWYNEERQEMDELTRTVIWLQFYWLDVLKWPLLNICWAIREVN